MTTTCAHSLTAETTCERIHVGEIVKVAYGQGQLGFGQTGEVVAADGERFTVHFPDGAAYPDGTLVEEDLTYAEHELESLSA